MKGDIFYTQDSGFFITQGEYDDLKKKEKVLEIIKKKQVNVYMVEWFCKNSDYKGYCMDFDRDYDTPAFGTELLTETEFNLIKEWLKNE